VKLGARLLALAALAVVVLAPAACGSSETRTSNAVPAAATPADRTVFVVLGGDETIDSPGVGSLTRAWEQIVYTRLPTSAVLVDLADRRPTAKAVIQDQLPKAQALHPTVATVWLGLGDREQRTSEATFSDHAEQIVTGLQDAGTRTVLLLSPRPDPDTPSAGDPDDEAGATGTTEPRPPERYAAAVDAVAARTGARVVPLPPARVTQGQVAAAVQPLVAP
jgi:hypothetical protein